MSGNQKLDKKFLIEKFLLSGKELIEQALIKKTTESREKNWESENYRPSDLDRVICIYTVLTKTPDAVYIRIFIKLCLAVFM